MQVSIPNMPQILTYAVLGSVGIDVILAVLFAVRGDLLGVILVLAIAAGAYWFVGRHAVTLVPATTAAAAGAVILLIAALADLISGHPYYSVATLLATAALGFVCALLFQGARPEELELGGVVVVNAATNATLLAMLGQLRDAGVLTAEEYSAKAAALHA